MTPTPYLFFNGQCAEAIAVYVGIFGGEILMQLPASEMPPEYTVPEDRKDWVMHATMKIDNGFLMASDNVMGEAPAMAGSSVMMSLPTVAEGKAAFDQLAEGGISAGVGLSGRYPSAARGSAARRRICGS